MTHPLDDDLPDIRDLLGAVKRPTWMRDAECRGLNPNLFFPERGEIVSEEARSVCAECTVSRQCLEYALATCERDGMWGGKSGRQRRDMRAATVERDHVCVCIQCGGKFRGNYRSKICSPQCRAARNNARPRRGRNRSNP